MSFLSPFFTEKTLITILKVIPLNRDVHELIIWKIIDGMVIDIISDILSCEEIVEFDDEIYYYHNYYYDVFE